MTASHDALARAASDATSRMELIAIMDAALEASDGFSWHERALILAQVKRRIAHILRRELAQARFVSAARPILN